jgi:hypothetical protein
MKVKQVEVFWVVTPFQTDGGSMDIRNVDILSQYHTASPPGRPRLEYSPPLKSQPS